MNDIFKHIPYDYKRKVPKGLHGDGTITFANIITIDHKPVKTIPHQYAARVNVHNSRVHRITDHTNPGSSYPIYHMVYVMPGENTGESQNTGSAFITNGHQFAKIYFLDTGYSAYPPARYVEFVPTYGRIPVTRTQIKIKIQELIQELV